MEKKFIALQYHSGAKCASSVHFILHRPVQGKASLSDFVWQIVWKTAILKIVNEESKLDEIEA